jgi:hypothetical protein
MVGFDNRAYPKEKQTERGLKVIGNRYRLQIPVSDYRHPSVCAVSVNAVSISVQKL